MENHTRTQSLIRTVSNGLNYSTNMGSYSHYSDLVAKADIKFRVLIIEDEKEIRDLLVSEFQDSGVEAIGRESGEGLLEEIESINPSIILMDNLMPGKTGIEIVKIIRANTMFCEIPIMMLTALDSERDKLMAFDAGADDYVTKPFSIREVLARSQALVRRAMGLHRTQQKKIESNRITIDLMSHRVYLDSNEIKLTLTEFKILCEILRQAGQVLSRDQLRERALGNMNVSDRTIDVHMASLRKKMGDIGDEIETVRGVGYRMQQH